MFHVPEDFRLKHGVMRSDKSYGNNGAFIIPYIPPLTIEPGVGSEPCTEQPDVLQCIASDAGGWEHVSISIQDGDAAPTWDMMCFIKKLFWDEDDLVVQYHPRKQDYVNIHNVVLHLWRPVHGQLSTPPVEFV